MEQKQQQEGTLVRFDEKKDRRLQLVIGLAVVAAAVFVLFAFILGASRVDGESMSPTLADGQTVFYRKICPDLKRGEIVAIDMTTGSGYIKRIVALPGDTVDIRDGNVYVNGEKEETAAYAFGTTEPEGKEISYPYQVADGMYFVLGDNREGSVDSRTFGAIARTQIKGVILGGD